MRRRLTAVLACGIPLALTLSLGTPAFAQVPGGAQEQTPPSNVPAATCSNDPYTQSGADFNGKPIFGAAPNGQLPPTSVCAGAQSSNPNVPVSTSTSSTPSNGATTSSPANGGTTTGPSAPAAPGGPSVPVTTPMAPTSGTSTGTTSTSSGPTASCPPVPQAQPGGNTWVGASNGTLCLLAELTSSTGPATTFDVHQSFTLSGFAFDASAAPGSTGISHLEVFLNGTPAQNGAIDLGPTNVGNSGGVVAPSGYPPQAAFSATFNPQNNLPTTPSQAAAGTTNPWPTGGNTLYVYAYGASGATVGATLPFTLQ